MKLEAPPIPKKEKTAVTIANQALQIDHLLTRIENQSNEIGRLRSESNSWRERAEKLGDDLALERQFRMGDVARANEAAAKIAKLESQLEGYRMAVKDINHK